MNFGSCIGNKFLVGARTKSLLCWDIFFLPYLGRGKLPRGEGIRNESILRRLGHILFPKSYWEKEKEVSFRNLPVMLISFEHIPLKYK